MSSSNAELARKQAEALSEIGSYLRQQRQLKDLPIETIATQTRIPVRILKAIEVGDLDTLPEAVYIQGLIRRFADAVGVDGVSYSAQFPTGIDPTPRFSQWRKTPAAQLRPLHLYLAYLGIVVLAVTGLSISFERSQRQGEPATQEAVTPPSGKPNTPTATKPANAPAPSPAPVAVATPTPQASAKPVAQTTQKPNETQNQTQNQKKNSSGNVSIELMITSESWLQVVADGKTEFEGVLSKGKQAWSANSEITVITGNAGGIMVTVNGGKAEPLGQPGSVEEVTFMADSRVGSRPNSANGATSGAANRTPNAAASDSNPNSTGGSVPSTPQ